MHYRYLLLIAFLSATNAWSQSRLVMTGSSYIVIDNNAKVVVENPATDAITNSGTGGIMTESEFDQVIWNIGTGTGAYVMPFVSQAAVTQIPFTVNITAPGTGAGQLLFSTYPGPVADNNTYRPSDVTHMYDYNTGSVNNSSHTIDRFWIADASGYGTKPSATLQFTYRDAEHLQTGNSIVEGSLGAQRFNSLTNHWGDYLPQGITNTATNTTSNVPAVPANFFRSWTLSEITTPLAIELAYFKSSCSGSSLTLSWQTTSETDVDHFEIEHYLQGQFSVIGFIQPQPAEGIRNYTFTPGNNREGVFRLVEVDMNGNRYVRSSVSATCSLEVPVVVSYNSEMGALHMSFEGNAESLEMLQIYDAGGKLVFVTELEISKGVNAVVLPDMFLSTGMYMVRLQNGQALISEKVIAAR